MIALAVVITALAALGTARATRLIAADRVTLPIRRAIVGRWGPSSAIGYFIHCRWCVSMYVSIPPAAATVWLWLAVVPELRDLLAWPHRIVLGVLMALAYSHLTALLAALEDED